MLEKKKAKSVKKPVKKKKAVKKEKVEKEQILGSAVPDISAQPSLEVKEKVLAPKPAVPKEEIIFKPKKPRLPKGPKYYGTGRRKEAVAKVWLKPGTGQFFFNGKSLSEYFCQRKLLEYKIMRPFEVTNTSGAYDVHAELFGGGVPGQAGAVCLGISRALLAVNPDFRIKLKREGLLRRDPRMKERKKYGHKRARKSFQYTKR